MSDAEHGQPALKRARLEVGMNDSRAKKLGFEIGIAIEQLTGCLDKEILRTEFLCYQRQRTISKKTNSMLCAVAYFLPERTYGTMCTIPMPFGRAKVFTFSRWADILSFLDDMQEVLEHVDKFPERVDIVVDAIDSQFTVISRELAFLVTLTDAENGSVADSLLHEYAELVHRAAQHNVFFNIQTDEPRLLKDFLVTEEPVTPPSPPTTLPPSTPFIRDDIIKIRPLPRVRPRSGNEAVGFPV
jgi:hypothetical protein